MKWSMVNLPEICRPRQWKTLSKKEMAPEGYPVYGANGRIGFSETFTHEEPVILIGCRGTCGSVHVTEPKSYANGNAMALDDLDERRVNLQFLASVLKGADFSKVITGVAQPQITGQSLARFQIPLPPLAEQKRIAAILDAADALRAKRREALAQLDALLQSSFLTLFGDPKEGVSIGELVDRKILLLHKDGNHGGLYPRAEEFGNEGIPFISAKCISDSGDMILDEVQLLNEKKARTLRLGWIQSGDVLLAHNASVGKTHLYRGTYKEALIGTSLTSFRPNPVHLDSCYLLGALCSNGFQAQLFSNMGQTTRNQVPITAQRRLTIPLPPLPLQQKFAAIVESIERQKTTQRAHLAELAALFAALQHRAFRGEL